MILMRTLWRSQLITNYHQVRQQLMLNSKIAVNLDDTAFNQEEYQAILKDKTLMRVFDHLLKEKVEIAKKEIMEETASVLSDKSVMTKGKSTIGVGTTDVALDTDQNELTKEIEHQVNKLNKNPLLPAIKSPSDTTLYAPAVRKLNQNLEQSGEVNQIKTTTAIITEPINETAELIKRISNFVDSIRVSDQDRIDAGGSGGTHADKAADYDERAAYCAAKERAEQAILDAEKYKAMLADPPGKLPVAKQIEGVSDRTALQNIKDIGSGLSDDDFFHLTCHVDGNLITKIENGEFVDLDKLLPKDKKRKGDDNRMEWIHSDGGTYLAPISNCSTKITGFRRWEQAFRIYSTIYCGANPSRSKEMWQYISVISIAASAYIWDNVYDYDVTFRHLMVFNPSRSWAVTYNQMWNLCMREPVAPRTQNFGKFQSAAPTKQNTGHKKRGKPNYCWNFNSGIKCSYGKKCRFVEHCSYCDNASHGVHQCSKAIAANVQPPQIPDKKDKDHV